MRPIVSGINWATENSAILLDEVLKPYIYQNKHIPKDNFEFIKILEEQQYGLRPLDHKNIFMGTFDVVSLYTAIPQDTATRRITQLIQLNKNTIPANIFTELTQYILSNNFFSFQGTFYKQEHGIAMGNPAGGAIANTYMLVWDKIIMNHPINSKYLNTYARYYDDGFFIRNGPEDSLTIFLSYINSIDKHIQTTSSYGKTTINLDIQITLTEHNSPFFDQTKKNSTN